MDYSTQNKFDSGRTVWVIVALTIFNYMFDYTSNVEFEYTKMYQRSAVGGGEDQLICADSVARVNTGNRNCTCERLLLCRYR